MNRLVVMVAVAATLGGCASPTPPPPNGPLSITVSMFSGRPDPRFELSPSDSVALRDCLNQGGTVSTAAPPSGLGFRYFIVEGLSSAPVLIAKSGAWNATTGQPIPACDGGYTLLRTAAAAALDATTANAIPE